MGKIRIRDMGWKKFGSGIRYNKHPGSATLHFSNIFQDEDALERASGKRILVYPFDR
jgi:hypothetical protein